MESIIEKANKLNGIINKIEKYEVNGVISSCNIEKICKEEDISILQLMNIAKKRNKLRKCIKIVMQKGEKAV